MYVELLHVRENIAQHEAELVRDANVYRQRTLERDRSEESLLLESIQRFAGKHALPVRTDILNLGHVGQLALF